MIPKQRPHRVRQPGNGVRGPFGGTQGRLEQRQTGGFSLVEMMAATLIFGIGVLAVLEVIATSLRSTTSTLGYTQAVFLAQQKMEESLAAGSLTVSEETGDCGAAFPNHSWKQQIEEVQPGRLYRVRVDVSWNDGLRDRQFTLTTFAANRQ